MKRLVVLFLAVAACVGLAAYLVPANAANVDGGSVSRRALDRDLSAIASSSEFQCYLSERQSLTDNRVVNVRVEGASQTANATSVYATSFVDGWLGQMVQAKVAADLIARQGMTVTAGDLAVARAVLERRITYVLDAYAQNTGTSPSCGGSGAAVLASVPASFAAEQVRGQAGQSVLAARAVGAGLATSQLQGYFAAHRSEFDRVCVSVVVVRTKSTAVHLQQTIKGGTPFAQVAKSNSITPTTGANGGAVGCTVIAGTSLSKPLEHLGLNQVSTPISYKGVYLLAEVTSRTPSTFAAVRRTVTTVMLLAGQPRAEAELSAALKAADIRIDPRFGSVKTSGTIRPPTSPPLTALLTVGANTPGGTPGAG